jgi:hypothetical protein
VEQISAGDTMVYRGKSDFSWYFGKKTEKLGFSVMFDQKNDMICQRADWNKNGKKN